jgi:4-amino-4-deoxy-L-arabinose transferase-like glycosyltransferase
MADSPIDRWLSGGWRGPLFAALVALAAGLPGMIAMPVLDRDEPRFAEASAQMLETGDFVSIQFQESPRNKKPIGIHWLQALSVAAVSSVEKRQIWAYRLPSLAGAMLAAAGCAWGAATFFGPRGGALAGAVLGSSLILSTEALLATTDAALAAAITWMMASLARIYASSRGEGAARVGVRAIFWGGLAASILLKGPIGPLVAALTMLSLWAWDRSGTWLRSLGWAWGIAMVLAICGPWAMAITVTTDGAFWGQAVVGDMASKLASGQESHGAPPGLHALLSPLLLFPATVLLPAGLVWGVRHRGETAARFALCWLVPSWIVFELAPTKLPHYTLPLYGALAFLIAGALAQPLGRIARMVGAGLGLLMAAALAAACVVLAQRYGSPSSLGWAIASAVLLAGAGVAGLGVMLERRTSAALALTAGLGVLGHDVMAAGLAPSLKPLWVSTRMARAVQAVGLDPRNGTTPGPIAVDGYEEPSIVFLLGARTELGDADDAAAAIAEGRPAIVAQKDFGRFQDALKADDARASPAAEVKGLDYSKGKPVDLVLYRSLEERPPPGDRQ